MNLVSPKAAEGGAPTFEHALHEARHTVTSWFFEVPVESVAVGVHSHVEGEMWTVSGREIGPEDLIISLTGWMGDPNLPPDAEWPERWPVRENAPEGIGSIVRRLGLDQETYERLCGVAEQLVELERFKEATRLVARALMVAPRIDREGLELLREQTAFADSEPEAALA